MSEIYYNNKKVNEAIFPDYEVGKIHDVTLQLYNDYDVSVEYEITGNGKEQEIIDYTKKLGARETGNIKIRFTPDISRRSPFLSSITILERFR